MNSAEYKSFYNRVGKKNGWDFSKVKCVSEGIQWDFYHEVTKLCKKSDLLLDIGTGGGEAILSIADSALLLVGIDHAEEMINTAARNAVESGIRNVRFMEMDAEQLNFPPHFFDIVSSRHSSFSVKEIAKVLSQDGFFLTQQVSEGDKRNIKEAFGRGQAWGVQSGILKNQYMKELAEAGFADIQAYESNAAEYYQTPEDLLFLLKHTPIIPNFGQSESDFHIFQQFVQDHMTDRGIKTNAERFIIVAKK